MTTFQVGDKVEYQGPEAGIRPKGTRGVIDRPAPGTHNGWFVRWGSNTKAFVWTDEKRLVLIESVGPEEYEGWFR